MTQNKPNNASPQSPKGNAERTATNSEPSHRATGVLIGLAAGDRNGGPIRMAIRLAESILEQKTYNIGAVAESYLRWWQEGAFDTGATTGAVLQKLNDGLTLDTAAAQVHRESQRKTAGCSPAHRAAPIAAAHFLSEERLEQFAFLESTITHYDPVAGEAAMAVVVLSRKLILGYPWDQARKEASYGRHFKIDQALQVAKREELHTDGYAPHVLQAAIHFLHEHENFHSALTASIEFAGPANYCPVLVGSIGGARWGADAITADHLTHAQDLLPHIQQTAQTLGQTWEKT